MFAFFVIFSLNTRCFFKFDFQGFFENLDKKKEN